MNSTELEALIAKKAKLFLEQFCVAPGTPNWIAGKRDFVAGASILISPMR